MAKAFDEAHPTDLFVGRKIRARRRALNVSQEALAGALKLTFQQVQKYERGANRVSASKLKMIADALKCHPGDFFEGLENQPKLGEAGFGAVEIFDIHGGVLLGEAFLRMTKEQRDAIVRTALAISPPPVAEDLAA